MKSRLHCSALVVAAGLMAGLAHGSPPAAPETPAASSGKAPAPPSAVTAPVAPAPAAPTPAAEGPISPAPVPGETPRPTEPPAAGEASPSPTAPAAPTPDSGSHAPAGALPAHAQGSAPTQGSAGPAQQAPTSERVWLHFAVDYPAATLEGRSLLEPEPWRSLCAAPCKQYLEVEGQEVRVVAPGMAPSNAFSLQSGRGRAQFRVSGGSSTVKTVGLGSLIGGIPTAMAGMALLGVGSIEDKDGLRTGGIVTLAVGATAIAVAIPLLLMSTTRVYNAKSDRIAALEPFRF